MAVLFLFEVKKNIPHRLKKSSFRRCRPPLSPLFFARARARGERKMGSKEREERRGRRRVGKWQSDLVGGTTIGRKKVDERWIREQGDACE